MTLHLVTGLQGDGFGGRRARVAASVVGLGRGWGVGSGVVIADGQVLTNAHNLRGEEATVTFADGRRATGEVAGSDRDLDLAVVAVDTGDAPAIEWDGAGEHRASAPPSLMALSQPGRPAAPHYRARLLPEPNSAGRAGAARGAISFTAPLPRGSSGR